MCCICWGNKENSIPLNAPVTEQSILKGIKALGKKPIDSIIIELSCEREKIVYVVQKNACAQIHELASSFKRVAATSLFREKIEIIRKTNNEINSAFSMKNGSEQYYLTEDGTAKVTVTYKDNNTISSKEVAAALQDLFWIYLPVQSPSNSQPGTISSQAILFADPDAMAAQEEFS